MMKKKTFSGSTATQTIPPDQLEKIRLDRTIRGIPDRQIAADLDWPVSVLVEVAQRYGIERRKGPPICELTRQWAELEFRLPRSEREQIKTLAEINGWLAKRG